MRPDYYAILKVPAHAPPEEVRSAYRRLAKERHPDAGGRSEDFRTIQEAYEVLGDVARRREYDAQRQAAARRSARSASSSRSVSQPPSRSGSTAPIEPLIPPQPAEPLVSRRSGPRSDFASNRERDPLADFDRLFREFDEFFENLEKQFLETYWGRSD